MTAYTKMTTRMKTDILRLLYEDLAESRYYCFFGRYTPWSDADQPEAPEASVDDTVYGPTRELLYGKLVHQSDAKFLYRRHDWASNTAYDAYDDSTDLSADSFVVVTDERKTYKCLYNAAGAPSTSKPTITSNAAFTTGDGYVWKYMFTSPAIELTNHQTAMWTPICPNNDVQAAAVNGSIEVVLVEVSGNNWTACHSGSVQGIVAGNLFRVSNSAPSTNNLFQDSGFYVTTGPGAGSLSQIELSVTNSSGIFVKTKETLGSVSFGSGYMISPYVEVEGDGDGCRAVAYVNGDLTTVTSVQVVNTGEGYTRASVLVQAAAGASNASGSFRAVISPPGGHGSHPEDELLSDRLSVAVKTSNVDSFGFVDFRSAGLLKDPRTFDGDLYGELEFRATWTATCNLVSGSVDPLESDETITGQSGGATATVALANSTHVEFGDVVGSFSEAEVVRGSQSSSLASLTAINSPEIDPTSGTVLFVMNADAVQRSDSSIEFTRFIVSL